MRILYIIDSLAPGGAETSLAEMAPSLVELGVDLHVLPLGPRLDLADRLQHAGATVHPRHTQRGRMGNIRAIGTLTRRIHPTLLHTTLYESNVAGRIAAQAARVPVSTSLVGDTYGASRRAHTPATKLRLALVLDRFTAKYARRFHAVSAVLAAAGSSHLRIPADRIDVIPRGRDPHLFQFRPAGVRKSTRTALGIDERTRVVLAVGRHEPAKGLIDLVNAAPLISIAHPGTIFLLAGKDGSASSPLRKAAAQSGANVCFLGHRTDVPDLLAAADLLCFPSRSEGSPGTLIEAMAVGCPIVASDIPANLEVLGPHPQTLGEVSTAADSLSLAASVIKTLDDTESVHQRAHKARIHFEANFQIGSVSKRMLHFFERVAASPPMGTSPRGRPA